MKTLRSILTLALLLGAGSALQAQDTDAAVSIRTVVPGSGIFTIPNIGEPFEIEVTYSRDFTNDLDPTNDNTITTLTVQVDDIFYTPSFNSTGGVLTVGPLQYLAPAEYTVNVEMGLSDGTDVTQTEQLQILIPVERPDPTAPRVNFLHPLLLDISDTLAPSATGEFYVNTQVEMRDPNDVLQSVTFTLDDGQNGNGGVVEALPGGTITFAGGVPDRPNQVLGNIFSYFFDPPRIDDYRFAVVVNYLDDGVTPRTVYTPSNLVVSIGAPGATFIYSNTVDVPFGDTFNVGEAVRIVGTAVGGNIEMDAMSFYANGVHIGTIENPRAISSQPSGLDRYEYDFTWFPPAPGDYEISTRAIQVGPASGVPDHWRVSTPQTISVTGVAPVVDVSIVTPVDQSTIRVNAPISIEAEVNIGSTSDPVDPTEFLGNVEQVEFYVDSQVDPIGIDTSFPYRATFTPGSVGLHRITARAVMSLDASFDGASNFASTVDVFATEDEVASAPLLVVSVSGGGNITPSSSVIATATVFDDNPDDVEVEFFLNDNPIPGGDFTEPPYTVTFSPVPQQQDGFNYLLTVIATDSEGNTAVVESRNFIGTPQGSNLNSGVISLVSPNPGSDQTEGSRVPLRAEVNGALPDDLEAVVFYANGEEVGRDTEAPYFFDWIPDLRGQASATFNLQAASFSKFGSLQISEEFSVAVQSIQVSQSVEIDILAKNGSIPAVSIFALPDTSDNPLQTSIGSRIMLYANAIDLEDNIENDTPLTVEFYRDGDLIATRNQSPYFFVFDALEEGDFFYNARAIDSDDNRIFSRVIPIRVNDVVSNRPQLTISDDLPPVGTVGTPILVEAELQNGFITSPDSVVFYANGEVIGSDSAAPFSISWTPLIAGTEQTASQVFLSVAATRDVNQSGNQAILRASSGITAVVIQPPAVVDPNEPPPDTGGGGGGEDDPPIVDETTIFIERTFDDLLFRDPTGDEVDEFKEGLNDGSIADSVFISELINTYIDYRDTRNVLMIHYLLTGEFPSREELGNGVTLIRRQSQTDEGDGADDAPLVDQTQTDAEILIARDLLSTFRERFYDNRALPDASASDEELELFFRTLWTNKYGIPAGEENRNIMNRSQPTQQNIDRALTLLRFFFVDEFVANFALDNDFPDRNRLLITPIYGFRNVPNNRLPQIADAASIQINLLRNETDVAENALASLGSTSLQLIREAIGGSNVETGSPYAMRLMAPMSAMSMVTSLVGPVEVMETAERVSPWFDSYYDNKAPWIYHEDHGWLYIRFGPQGGLWAYDLQLGWLFTKEDWFPWMFSANDMNWLYYDRGSGVARNKAEMRAFFDYDVNLPGNGLWIEVEPN